MKQEYQDLILQACGATALRVGEKIQTLWSGYGQIVRVHLEGCEQPSVVVKHVMFPKQCKRPGGSNTDLSHMRKVRSYHVETYWYQNYSTNDGCRMPACLAAHSYGDEHLIVLEDLDVAGFNQRRTSVTDAEIRACLSWLANFHALFLGVSPEGLWPIGTYWHLETRPDELEAMDDAQLKAAAGKIDRVLNECRFKTIVHGDAKLANFCFSGSGRSVAAVDFQYVGGGCGMKDVIYILEEIEEKQLEKRVPGLLDHYFTELRASVSKQVDFNALEKEWRDMFAFAWTDFHRFLLGWMPGHRKINRYTKQLTKEVLRKLKL
ncbi:uncharacterized protein pkdc [Esox lucius]|uniref:Aminoglycoside phosphotransferase domain-containing protein n=1 Tax=Esox lucius TaxID=8010 RepID=A0AAY5KWZ2_ESOLU|nr:uncharacterized protein pkdc [Esox lucius]XP_010883593.2 uncharacterized protein pkdc [Esox lucius]